MANELQPQLKLLAEKAGVEPMPIIGRSLVHFKGELKSVENQTLTDAECWTVLGWLHQAGFGIGIPQYKNLDITSVVIGDETGTRCEGHGNTLHKALARALLALPLT